MKQLVLAMVLASGAVSASDKPEYAHLMAGYIDQQNMQFSSDVFDYYGPSECKTSRVSAEAKAKGWIDISKYKQSLDSHAEKQKILNMGDYWDTTCANVPARKNDGMILVIEQYDNGLTDVWSY